MLLHSVHPLFVPEQGLGKCRGAVSLTPGTYGGRDYFFQDGGAACESDGSAEVPRARPSPRSAGAARSRRCRPERRKDCSSPPVLCDDRAMLVEFVGLGGHLLHLFIRSCNAHLIRLPTRWPPAMADVRCKHTSCSGLHAVVCATSIHIASFGTSRDLRVTVQLHS